MEWPFICCILETAVELKDKIEEQRAFATIGRVHLLRVQSNPSAHDSVEMVKSVKNAEKAFLRSLLICNRFDCLMNTANRIPFALNKFKKKILVLPINRNQKYWI